MIPRRRMPIERRDVAEWLRAVRHPHRDTHTDVLRFEKAFAEYVGCAFARATASGRDAIELAMDAVRVKPGDEIIVPAFTLGELMPLLQAKGFRPVPADVEEDTFNMDVRCVAARIGPRTRAILATHLLGAPCDIQAICELARRHGIAVVEDCAHALGATVSGRKVGSFGEAAIFSFEVNKAVPTYGGGIVVTNNPDIAASVGSILDARPRTERPALKKARSRWIEECLIRSPFYGVLARIIFSERFATRFERFYRGSHDRQRAIATAYSGFQARLGLARLARVDARNERLNRLWDELARRLPAAFKSQKRDRVGQPAFYNFVVVSAVEPAVLRRRALRCGLDIGIGTEVMDDCGRLLGAQDCPVATRLAERVVLLPLYDGLSRRRFERLVSVLNQLASGEGT